MSVMKEKNSGKSLDDPAKIEDYLLTLKDADTGGLIKRAEEAMRGMLVLNGTGPEPVFAGIPPKWDENPCGVGGYTWTISRLKYMVTLCKAFLLTKQKRYLEKVEFDLMDWFDKEPAPPVPHDYESACYYHGVHNWRMLEVGYRMVYTFPILLGVLRVYGSSPTLADRIQDSIAEHAERISAGSHLLWPQRNHNHYTEEINGLLSAASMIPGHPRADVWMDQAMAGLEEACASQLTEDGAQIEGAFEYHSAVVINFCYSIHFASQCGRSFSSGFVNRVKKGIAYSIHTLGPDSRMLPYGDSDAALATPIEAAMLGYLLFDEPQYLATLRQFIPEQRFLQVLSDAFPWGFKGIPALLALLSQPLPSCTKGCEEDLLPACAYQRQMDQYIVRTSWNRNAACLFFSCHSPIHYGNHAHMDQLGIIFGAYGKILLQDPGRYTYKDCEDRHLYKSSQVHNVPTVNGRDGFEYQSTFAYGPQMSGSITGIMDTPRLNGVRGQHMNYAPVECSRSAALVDGSILLIADTFRNIRGNDMKVYFHLNSTNVTAEGSGVVTHDPDVNLKICSSLEGAELLEGRLSDVFYHDYPSKRAVFSRRASQDAETLFFAAAAFPAGEPDSLTELTCENEEITFSFRNKPYRIIFRDGLFVI